MLMRDQPAAIDLAQDGGAATAAGGFLAFDQALPTEFIVTDSDFCGRNGP
jgi:hypothetical protein